MSHTHYSAASSILGTSLSLPRLQALPTFAQISNTLIEGVPHVNPVPTTQQLSSSLSSTAVGMKGRSPDVDTNQGVRTFKLFWRLYTYSPEQGTFLPVPAMPRHLPRQIRRALETLHLINTAGEAFPNTVGSLHICDLLPLLPLFLPFQLCNPPRSLSYACMHCLVSRVCHCINPDVVTSFE